MNLTVFSDSGAIVFLDPEHTAALLGNALHDLNAVLDPDGRTNQTVGFTADEWKLNWTEAAARLHNVSAGGRFVLLLSGEGTFSLRLQEEPLALEEQDRVVESFEEKLLIRSGFLAVTDCMPFFEGETELDEGVTDRMPLPPGLYRLQIHRLASPASLTPTVGVHGTPEFPDLVLVLRPATADVSDWAPCPDFFPRLRTTAAGHNEYEPGWNCRAKVMRVAESTALVRIRLTESTYSGYGEVIVPECVLLNAGDAIVVRLETNSGGRWKCTWIACDGAG